MRMGIQRSTTEIRELELSQLSVGDSHGKLVVEEKKSACEDLVCD
jgi:hypothetical protein